MTSERWEEINRLYYSAIELEETRRESFLSEACGTDTDLRQEVESLLAMHVQVDGFLEKPAMEEVAKTLKDEPPSLLGRQLGHYQILGVLGSGGMGEVYKARDTQLGRYVAIKVLPSHLVSDSERKKRLVQEAKAASALNHPNIVTIHEIASDNGMNFIVMEQVAGRTLDLLIPRKGMRLKEGLGLAIQVTRALAAAHAVGIIHRDLKPANIMVDEKDQVKILDFGLAKWVEKGGGLEADETRSNETNPKTEEGAILGTVSYMSPEQAEGKKLDHRSDIFSLGCVIYEMFTGGKAFQRESRISTLAAILREEPRLASEVAKDLPLELESIITRCLKKDPSRRFQHVDDIQVQLEELREAVESGKATLTPALQRKRSGWPWALAGAVAIGLIVAAAAWWRSIPPVSQPLIRLSVDLPDFALASKGPSAILSPDGSRLVYTGRGADGKSRLYTRMLSREESTPLAGTENGEIPFFSPDGQWIGFFANDGLGGGIKVKKISVEGGPATILADVLDSLGGSWGEDGKIITSVDLNAGLSRVPSGGGKIEPLAGSHTVPRKIIEFAPQVLPRAEAVLFTSSPTYFDESYCSVDVQSLRTDEVKTLARPGHHGRYASSGHLLYLNRGTLYAAPMDVRRMELTGPVAQVVENVANINGFDVDSSRSGTLVYVPRTPAKQKMVWLDSAGHTQLLRDGAVEYVWTCRFSPDGKRLAMSIRRDGNADLWVYEVERDTLIRLTSTPSNDYSPVWSPDGNHIAFSSTMHGGAENLYWARADGAGQIVRLTESANMQIAGSFSPDGKHLAFMELNPQTNWDIWTLPLEDVESDHPKPLKAEPFLVTPSNEWFPMISPDGKWLAYNSNSPDAVHVEVRPFPGRGGKWEVSTGSGAFPVWSRKGQELFYLSDEGGGVVMMTGYTVGGGLLPAKPRVWVQQKDLEPFDRPLDLAPDGRRFVMVQDAESKEKGPTHVMVLLNFFDELRRRAPTGGR